MYHPSKIDFHEKQRARRFFSSPLTFVALGVLIVIAGYNAWDMYQKSRHTKEMLAKTQEAYGELAAREAFLDTKLEELSTDAGVEAEIRERFGVAKAGEEVIVVLSEEGAAPPAPQKRSWWARIKSWFSVADGDYVKE